MRRIIFYILSLLVMAAASSWITLEFAAPPPNSNPASNSALPDFVATLPIYYVEFRSIQGDIPVRFKSRGPTALMRVLGQSCYRFIDADRNKVIQVDRKMYYLKFEVPASGGIKRGDQREEEGDRDFVPQTPQKSEMKPQNVA